MFGEDMDRVYADFVVIAQSQGGSIGSVVVNVLWKHALADYQGMVADARSHPEEAPETVLLYGTRTDGEGEGYLLASLKRQPDGSWLEALPVVAV